MRFASWCPASESSRVSARCLSTSRPTQKKVARALCLASASVTAGVNLGWGPSSKVSATALRPRGPDQITGPKTVERGWKMA